VRPLTHQQYAQHVRLYLGPALGKHQQSKLSPQHVQAFVNQQLKSGLSPRTAQLSLVILRHALDTAVKWSLVGRNVAKLVDPPQVKRHETKPFTRDEARTFCDAVQGKRWRAAYLTALILGLREGELLGLRWQDVDFDRRTLTVNQTVQRIRSGAEGDGSSLEFCETKTNRSRRTLSLSPSLIAILKAHRVSQSKARLVAGSEWRDLGLVFSTSIGTPIEKSNLFRDFKRMLKDTKLPPVRFHDLRHSTASLLLAQGVHPRAIMELLGHSRIGVTMDTYAHVMPAMLEDVAMKMDAVLNA
jgi:integrase